MGALHRSGVSLHPYPDQKEVSLSWQTSQKSLAQGLEYMPNMMMELQSSLHTFLTFIHNGNLNDDLGSEQKLYNLRIVQWCRAISRL